MISLLLPKPPFSGQWKTQRGAVRVPVPPGVKEFTKSGSKRFIHFPSEERGQTLRVTLALKGKGFELLAGYSSEDMAKSLRFL